MKNLRWKLRVIRSAFELTLKGLLADPWWFIHNTVAPFVFAIVALMFFKMMAMQDFALYAIFGSGVAGMWATALFGTGYALQSERWMGTIEYTFVVPAKLFDIVLGRALAYALFGLTLMLEVLGISTLMFNIPLEVANPVAFLIAMTLTILSFTSIGLVFSTYFVLSREASAYANFLEGFAYAVCGVMYPVSILPFWVQLISYSMSPTWGVNAIRMAAESTQLPNIFYMNVAFLVLTTLIYAIISLFLFKLVEQKAREKGELSRY